MPNESQAAGEHGVAPAGSGSWFRSDVAPLSLRESAIYYGLVGLPSVIWALTGWPTLLLFVAWIPGLVLATRWGRRRARHDGAPPRTFATDLGPIVLVGACAGLMTGPLLDLEGGRYLGFFCIGLALALEPISRRSYRRRLQQR